MRRGRASCTRRENRAADPQPLDPGNPERCGCGGEKGTTQAEFFGCRRPSMHAAIVRMRTSAAAPIGHAFQGRQASQGRRFRVWWNRSRNAAASWLRKIEVLRKCRVVRVQSGEPNLLDNLQKMGFSHHRHDGQSGRNVLMVTEACLSVLCRSAVRQLPWSRRTAASSRTAGA